MARFYASREESQALLDNGLGSLCHEPLLSPININHIAKYTEIPLKIISQKVTAAHLVKETQSQFFIDANFGKIQYANLSFQIYRLVLKIPGEHQIASLGFSLEMQLEAKKEDNARLLLCILFEVIEDFANPSLDQFKLKKNIKKLKIGQATNLKTVDVSVFAEQVKKLYMYPGQLSSGKCDYAVTLISADAFFVGAGQLGGFELTDLPGLHLSKTKPPTIYQNFMWWNFERLYTYLQKVDSLRMSDAPVPAELSSYMYNPSDSALEMGAIPSDERHYLLFWRKPADAEEFPAFAVNPSMKLFALYYQLLEEVWQPRMVLIPANYEIDLEDVPNFMPVYFRSNFIFEGNNVRPVQLVEMPISFNATV